MGAFCTKPDTMAMEDTAANEGIDKNRKLDPYADLPHSAQTSPA